MSRVSKNNRFDSQLWANLEKISDNTKIPMSRLLDEGLEYLTSKYLTEQKHPISAVSIDKRDINPIVTDDSQLPNDLISSSDANRKYKVSFPMLAKWADRGIIKRYKPEVKGKASTFYSEQEIMNHIKARNMDIESLGDLIPMAAASRIYKISDKRLTEWANGGFIKRQKRPAGIPETIIGYTFVSRKELEEFLESRKKKDGDQNVQSSFNF